jgi:AraC family transcriptional regulator
VRTGERFDDLHRLTSNAREPIAFQVANPSGSVMLVDSEFAPFEGALPSIAHACINLSTGEPARFYHRGRDRRIEGIWRSGDISITLPHEAGECRTGRSTVVGLAINLDDLPCDDCRIIADDLANAARGLNRDPMVAAVMMALRHTAEVHGASSAFFDHGIAVILNRLALLNGQSPAQPRSWALSAKRLKRVEELIDSALAGDITVGRMALEAGLSRASFTRAFQLSTGYTPYAYLTKRRMDRAKELLATGVPVTLVALSVGYANPSKFAAAFRRWCRVPPSQWGR